jgi:hypothetical protein
LGLTNIPRERNAHAMDSRFNIPATPRAPSVLTVFAQVRFGFFYELL